jgi:glycosyltransferase involved in cell wall biosynthesis
MVLDREFPPDIRVENEISALSQAGHDVHIACYTRKNKPEYEKTSQVTIHRKPISPLIYKSSVASLTLPGYFLFWKRFLRKILSNEPFDVLHIHDLPLVGVGRKLKKDFPLKLIADLHENWPAFLEISKHTNTPAGKILSPIFLWRRYEKRILQHADAIIVVVEEAKDRLIGLGIPSAGIFVVSNTINLGDVQVTDRPYTGGAMLYYAGGINFHRGLQNVILAMHRARNKQIKFRILGEGSYKTDLEKLTESLSLNNSVIFEGYQPFRKVMDMLSESDFAIIPHIKTEHTDSTIPHKLFQYMYAQKPVIASDCLPIKRIMEETGSGFVYPSNDIERLGALLDRLGTTEYNDMGIRGRKAVIEKYNWENDSRVLAEIYRDYLPRQVVNH